jgi:hypothetical protein
VELVKAEAGLLWHSDRTGKRSEFEPSCFGRFMVKRVKDRMENTGCEVMANALCGLLLWMLIAVEASWSLAPSFIWTQGIWLNLLCGGYCHYHGTCNTEVSWFTTRFESRGAHGCGEQ